MMKSIRIENHRVGYGKPVFIIAEAGVNHNGRLDYALQLIDVAADAGANAIKFQTFRAEQVVTVMGEMADYQKKNLGASESQLSMLKKLELPESFYPKLIRHARKRNIVFLSTPHGGFASVDFLVQHNIPAFKFGSGDLTNTPLLAYAGRFKKPMIVSTGMGTMQEIHDAIRTIHDVGNNNIIVAHCTTDYPPESREINLRAMETMMKGLSVPVGYSYNGRDSQIPLMAATLGACFLETHVTLDRTLVGPDHHASFEPFEFKTLVSSIRAVSAILGSPLKKPTHAEKKYIPLIRRSLVAACDIKKGESFSRNNITIKRPGTGMKPNLYNNILGKAAVRDISKDSLISPHFIV